MLIRQVFKRVRVGRFLEREGLLERDAENSYMAGGGALANQHASRGPNSPGMLHRRSCARCLYARQQAHSLWPHRELPETVAPSIGSDRNANRSVSM